MEIITDSSKFLTFYEVAFLQSADDTAEMNQILHDYQDDPETNIVLDYIVSQYDFLFEMPEPEPLTFGQFWLPSFREVVETISYIVIRDFTGSYAIYKKAWM